jgi:hypothetical protein
MVQTEEIPANLTAPPTFPTSDWQWQWQLAERAASVPAPSRALRARARGARAPLTQARSHGGCCAPCVCACQLPRGAWHSWPGATEWASVIDYGARVTLKPEDQNPPSPSPHAPAQIMHNSEVCHQDYCDARLGSSRRRPLVRCPV